MNERAVASIQSIRDNILDKPPQGLLYMAVFGSQVKGTERPDSDLDIMYVVNDNSLPVSDVRRAAKIPGGVKMVTILPRTPESLYNEVNIYGTVDYHVFHGKDTRVLYQSPDFHVMLDKKVDYAYCVDILVKKSEVYVYPEQDHSETLPGMACFGMHIGIDCLLQANLLSIKVLYPFTRDISVLYHMLPPERRPPLDVDMLADIWRRYMQCGGGKNGWTHNDVREAKGMARRVYEFTVRLLDHEHVHLAVRQTHRVIRPRHAAV